MKFQFKQLSFVAACFLTSLFVNADEITVPIATNPATFSPSKMYQALFDCGVPLVNKIKDFPLTSDPDRQVHVSISNTSNYFSTVEGEGKISYEYAFGMQYFMDVSQTATIKDSLGLQAVVRNRQEPFLFINFGKSLMDTHVPRVNLISKLSFPLFSFTAKEIPQCTFDQWGVKTCMASKYEYSYISWVIPYGNNLISPWKNEDTDFIIAPVSNFGDYMKCVEGKL